ncbi:hypothetical protein SNARM312S_05127 [Streptomyces narbonensis]
MVRSSGGGDGDEVGALGGVLALDDRPSGADGALHGRAAGQDETARHDARPRAQLGLLGALATGGEQGGEGEPGVLAGLAGGLEPSGAYGHGSPLREGRGGGIWGGVGPGPGPGRDAWAWAWALPGLGLVAGGRDRRPRPRMAAEAADPRRGSGAGISAAGAGDRRRGAEPDQRRADDSGAGQEPGSAALADGQRRWSAPDRRPGPGGQRWRVTIRRCASGPSSGRPEWPSRAGRTVPYGPVRARTAPPGWSRPSRCAAATRSC